jgi:hypothetical protein
MGLTRPRRGVRPRAGLPTHALVRRLPRGASGAPELHAAQPDCLVAEVSDDLKFAPEPLDEPPERRQPDVVPALEPRQLALPHEKLRGFDLRLAGHFPDCAGVDHAAGFSGSADVYGRAQMVEQRAQAAELVAAAFERIRLEKAAAVVPLRTKTGA